MVVIQSVVPVSGVRARQIVDFMLNCTDADYQRWWPGTHFHYHTVRRQPNDVGNVVYMDELVGERRLRGNAVVTEIVPEKRIVWQIQAVVPLPAHVELELEDRADGVHITHTIRAGFAGPGRILDPLFRLYLSRAFARAMDEHARTEFPKLAALLRERADEQAAGAA